MKRHKKICGRRPFLALASDNLALRPSDNLHPIFNETMDYYKWFYFQ